MPICLAAGVQLAIVRILAAVLNMAVACMGEYRTRVGDGCGASGTILSRMDLKDAAFVAGGFLLGPAGKEVAETLRLAVRNKLLPLQQHLAKPASVESFIDDQVTPRLAALPEERLQDPAPHVVVPALMAVAYTTSEELRALFANLLAKSMDSATAGDVHPSFVEVIKQLTPDEAKILKVLSPEAEFYDVYQIRHFEERGSMKHVVFPALTTLFDRAGTKRSLVSIDNITRQRIAEFATHVDSFTERFDILTPNDIDQYSAMLKVFDEEGPAMRKMLADGDTMDVIVRRLRLTSYGRSFAICCIDEPAPAPTASSQAPSPAPPPAPR